MYLNIYNYPETYIAEILGSHDPSMYLHFKYGHDISRYFVLQYLS